VLALLFDLFQFSREFLTSGLKLLQVDDLGLIRIEQTLVLTFQPLLMPEQLLLLCAQAGQSLLLGCGPTLVQLRDDSGLAQQIAKGLPYDLIEPIGTNALRRAFGSPTAGQG